MSSKQQKRHAPITAGSIAGSNLSNPKLMTLPPSNFIRSSSNDAKRICMPLGSSTEQQVQVIDGDILAKCLVQSNSQQGMQFIDADLLSMFMAQQQGQATECNAGNNVLVEQDGDEESTIAEGENTDTEEIEDDQNIESEAEPDGVIDNVVQNDREQGHNRRHNRNCCEERQRFERSVLTKLNDLLELQRGQNPVENRRRGEYPLLPPMPFNDLEALTQFDRQIRENEEMCAQFRRKIEEIGGKSVQKIVKFAMEAVMTDEITQRVVWVLGAENIPKLSKYKFPFVIVDIVRAAFDGTTKKAVENRIADWLRRGGDRLRAATVAANRRQERQQAQQ